MTLARTRCVALAGVHGQLVEVEADIATGLPAFALVGLPDSALFESRDRVRAAVVNSGEAWPNRRITVSLSPAWLQKRGSAFDLAVASVVLAGAGALPEGPLAELVLFGELGLDGRVRAVRGVLPAVLAAVREGYTRVVVPEGNAAEARLVPDAEVLGVRTLRHLLGVLRNEPADDESSHPESGEVAGPGPLYDASVRVTPAGGHQPDLADVLGQVEARRALEVSAAGGHHILLIGSPGAGKTMLAERLPGLLPPLDHDAALEVTVIHSVAGTLPPGQPLIATAPFCNPHHSASVAAVVGGGHGIPKPGAASLAHRGVLFLDEAPELRAGVLDALRQPLESGEIVLNRAAGTARYPARFTLVLAANPCPCGNFSGRGEACTCSPLVQRRYLGRLSGPLLDRVDLQVPVAPVSPGEIFHDVQRAESTPVVAARVCMARERARRRFAGTPWRTNAEVPGHAMRSAWRPPPHALAPAERAMEIGVLTARGVDRVLRVAWTLADLAGHACPSYEDVATALALRTGVAP